MLDSDCCAVEILLRNSGRDKKFQSDLETLANLRTNVTVMAEAVLPGYGKIYFAFLIHVANEIQLPSIYLLIACRELRKIFLRI